MEESISKHFCIIPWVHLYVTHEGDIVPCSKMGKNLSYGKIGTTDLNLAWVSPRAEEFRATMFAKSPSPLCCFCNQLTKSNIPPFRAHENRRFSSAVAAKEWTKGEKLVGNAKIRFLEIRFSNVCNLKCRTCEPWYSTSWYGEGQSIYGQKPPGILRAFRDSSHITEFFDGCVKDLEVLHIMGGEPLIQDDFYVMLDHLAALGKTDLKIDITTNFTRLHHKSWDFIKLAKTFPNMKIVVSLDGIGPQAEYIRKGCNWKTIESNIARFRNAGLNFSIYPCISVLNVFHITAAIDRWLELDIINESTLLNRLNFVTEQPKYYNIRVLNQLERKWLRAHYQDYLLDLQPRVSNPIYQCIKMYLTGILSFLNGGELQPLREEFRKITRKLDGVRQESFRELFPDLIDLYVGDYDAAVAQVKIESEHPN